MTNHSYFNLAGHKMTNEGILNHQLTIHANSYTEVDSEAIPTKNIIDLDKDVGMDFRKGKQILTAFQQLAKAKNFPM